MFYIFCSVDRKLKIWHIFKPVFLILQTFSFVTVFRFGGSEQSLFCNDPAFLLLLFSYNRSRKYIKEADFVKHPVLPH